MIFKKSLDLIGFLSHFFEGEQPQTGAVGELTNTIVADYLQVLEWSSNNRILKGRVVIPLIFPNVP